MITDRVEQTQFKSMKDFYIGLILAISSSVFIGSSFIFKKLALNRLAVKGLRASDGGFGYLFDWMWWMGMLLLAGGEIVNFVAYAFAPATMVTSLGALSVLVTAVLSSYCLHDRLNLAGKLACLVCITGSTMIVLHSPKEQEVNSMTELLIKVKNLAFIFYVIIVGVTSTILIVYFAPRYGHRNPLVYVTVTGAIGSLSVMWAKGFGVALKETLAGNNQFGNPFTWLLILLLAICISIQMNYLNKALDIFNACIVTPLLYALFTTLVIVASAILYREWINLLVDDVIGILCGFISVLAAIFLLHAFKDLPITLDSLNFTLLREEMLSSSSSSTTSSLSAASTKKSTTIFNKKRLLRKNRKNKQPQDGGGEFSLVPLMIVTSSEEDDDDNNSQLENDQVVKVSNINNITNNTASPLPPYPGVADRV